MRSRACLLPRSRTNWDSRFRDQVTDLPRALHPRSRLHNNYGPAHVPPKKRLLVISHDSALSTIRQSEPVASRLGMSTIFGSGLKE